MQQQQQQFYPPAQPMQQGQGQWGGNWQGRGSGGQQQYQQPSQPPNPVKLFENKNYCWTHGHNVKNDHTSGMCNNPLPGYQLNTTKTNTMGGNPKKDHKYIMPSQAGKQGLIYNQPSPGQRNQRGTGAP